MLWFDLTSNAVQIQISAAPGAFYTHAHFSCAESENIAESESLAESDNIAESENLALSVIAI